jgi:putative ABC transport system ATP-binding protein
MIAMPPAIAVDRVSKTYGAGPTAVRALVEVSLDVYGGEVLLMMGPSGSGKTTLLSIMGAILDASSGSVRVRGEELVGLPERERPRIRRTHIGFVFQGFNLFPALTALENVALPLDVRGERGPEARGRARAALERVGLGDKIDVHPADLSGGQKQRVAIARALIGDPSIVLADEPTAALDSVSGRTVLELLRDLARDAGRAIVLVTHDTRAIAYADRIVSIEDGRLREGAHDDAASRPAGVPPLAAAY